MQNESYRKVAETALRRAGQIQLSGLHTKRQVGHKGLYDLVTDIDRDCEQAVTGILTEAFPLTGILGEEDTRRDLDRPEVWIVDPLDGTTNYTHGYPVFCATIALRREGQIVLGMVYDPLHDELFEAQKGQGAFLNKSPITVSDTTELADSLLATGFPYSRCEQPQTNLDRFCTMTMRTQGVRRGGSAALDLCYTACGRLDGYWECELKPWDVCAGALIVEEAGGRVTDLAGQPHDWTGNEVLAANAKLHAPLLDSLSHLMFSQPVYG